MNFNPNGGTNTRAADHDRRIANAVITFEYDQPYQPRSRPAPRASVTSNVNIYVINAATGTVVVGAAQNQQQRRDPAAVPDRHDTRSRAAIIVADPGRIRARTRDTSSSSTPTTPTATVNVSTQYGSCRRHVLSHSFGHATAANTIGVGATPGGRRRPTWARTRWPTSRSARTVRHFTSSTPTASPLDVRP